MAQTQILRGARVPPGRSQASAANDAAGRGRRRGGRLWSLLHAQALLAGPSGGPHDATFIEDDYRRLAARQMR